MYLRLAFCVPATCGIAPTTMQVHLALTATKPNAQCTQCLCGRVLHAKYCGAEKRVLKLVC